jgi:Domain of unknown function (DUF1998).
MPAFVKKHPVGELRPSQLILSYGVGAIVDLPHMSTLIMGIDDWDTKKSEEISEPRLLQAIQSIMGPQVKQLLTPTAEDNPGRAPSYIGVPVAAFPRWMVCPACRLLASVDDGYFELKTNDFNPDRAAYRHINCPKAKSAATAPIVVPSRFLIACAAGHLDDFPWHHFIHGERACKAALYMTERSVSGEPSDIFIECRTCNQRRRMSDAFTSDDNENAYRPNCTGRLPHLRSYSPKKCQQQAKTTLLSASNTWFPLSYSSLSIPEREDPLDQLIDAYWENFEAAERREDLNVIMRMSRIARDFADYGLETIWKSVEKRRQDSAPTIVRPRDLKQPEWQVLTDPLNAPHTDDFEIKPTDTPEGYERYIQQVVLVERLREVLALTGFTRIESLGDFAEEQELPKDHIMPLSKRAPTWLPATEVRGEGIFIQFREEAIQGWINSFAVQEHNEVFYNAHKRWRDARKMVDIEANYPDIRYVLLHTFSHALIRQLTLHCGYAAASIRERIYSQLPSEEGVPMAGVLLYTAASDSEGTLGGLVNQGKDMGYHIDGILDDMEYCASDPLCAEHVSLDDNSLHGAACHACLFIPETSCESGNRYLDRSVLVQTVEREDLTFLKKLDI